MEKKRYLKKWVVPTTFVIALISMIGITASISQSIFKRMNIDNNSYVLRDIADGALPVVSEIKKESVKPYLDEDVQVHIGYYDINSKQEEQEKSLILYEDTYMPNTGILYGCEKKFEVVSIFEGEVISVKKDDVFGNIVEIKHTNNIVSKYSSLSEVTVAEGDTVNAGEVIGNSGNNKVVSVSQNMLLFELLYNGTNVNPEQYYNVRLDEMR